MHIEKIEAQIRSIREGMRLFGCPLPEGLDDVDPHFKSWLSNRFPKCGHMQNLALIVPTNDYLVTAAGLKCITLYGPETIIEMSDGNAAPFLNAAENSFIIIGSPYTPDRYLISTQYADFFNKTFFTYKEGIENWIDGDTDSFAEQLPVSIYTAFAQVKHNPELIIEFFGHFTTDEGHVRLRSFLDGL